MDTSTIRYLPSVVLVTLTSFPLAPAHTSTPTRPEKNLFPLSFRSSCGGTTLNPVLPGHHPLHRETLSDVFQASVVPQSNGIATLVLLLLELRPFACEGGEGGEGGVLNSF